MHCSNCGKELSADSKFCDSCGTAVAPEQETPAEVKPAEKAPVEATPVEKVPVVSAPAGEAVLTGKKGGKKAFALIGAAVVVLALLVVGIVALVSGGKSDEFVAYVTDDYELMYLKNTKEKTEAEELSDEANYNSAFALSPDGKYVYFKEFDEPEYSDYYAESTLMCMQVSAIGKEGEKAEKVDSDVVEFHFLDNGDLFYRKSDDEGHYDVYLYRDGEKIKLVKGINEYQIDEEEKFLYYTQKEDDTITLSRIALSGDGEKEKLLKDVDVIWSAYDAEILVYGEYNGSKDSYGETAAADSWYDTTDNDCYTVYSCTPGGDEKELVDNAVRVFGVRTTDGKLSFYYTTRNREHCTMYDFVTDNCAKTDEEILAAGYPEYPDYPNYPSYYWYEPCYLLGDDTNGYTGYYTYNDEEVLFENGFVTTDWSEAYNMAYELAWAKYDAAVVEYDAAVEEYYIAESAYYEAVEQYYAVENRQWLREDLKGWTYSFESFNLNKYENDQSAEIAEEVNSSYQYAMSDRDAIFFYQKAEAGAAKMVNIEDIDSSYDVYDLVEYGTDSEAGGWYLNVGGTESEMSFDTDDVQSIGSLYVLNGKELVVGLYDGNDSILEAYNIEASGLSFTSVVSDEYRSARKRTVDGEDVLVFFEDWRSDKEEGDLIFYSNGTRTTVAKDIYGCFLVEDSGAMYSLGELDTDRDGVPVSELSVKKGDKWVAIDEVYLYGGIAFLDGGKVLYLSDGDLMLWDGEESRRIAKDVVHFWADALSVQYF